MRDEVKKDCLGFYSSLRPHPFALALDVDDVIHVLCKRIIVRDDEELIEVVHLSDLLCESLAALGVHVDGRLVEKGQTNIGELLEECEANRERGGHLLAARKIRKGAFVSFFFQQNFIITRPTQSASSLARNLTEELVGFN